MRINRYLASCGLGSRRACEELISQGRVTINGTVIRELGVEVEEGDQVKMDGRICRPEETVTILLNKPRGVICSTTDPGDRKTVYDYLPSHFPRMFYVGRLDYESEGMLIMTNDGDLAQTLTHPKFKIQKVYQVQLKSNFDYELVPKLKKGMRIEPGFATMDAVFRMSEDAMRVVLSQGLKRQIRLMFLRLGYRVKRLKRIQIGKLELDKLPAGRWRYLKDDEIRKTLLECQGQRIELDPPKTARSTNRGSRASSKKPAKKIAKKFARKTVASRSSRDNDEGPRSRPYGATSRGSSNRYSDGNASRSTSSSRKRPAQKAARKTTARKKFVGKRSGPSGSSSRRPSR